jgi:Flp pilus assembly protein TadG
MKGRRPVAQASRRERGAVILEAGLTLILFFTLVFGIVGLGWAVYVYNQVSELAREATRYAIVRGATACPATGTSSPVVTSFVESRASGLKSSDLTVATTCTPNSNPGSVVHVQIQYALSPIVPLIPQQVLTLHSSSQMVISQ